MSLTQSSFCNFNDNDLNFDFDDEDDGKKNEKRAEKDDKQNDEPVHDKNRDDDDDVISQSQMCKSKINFEFDPKDDTIILSNGFEMTNQSLLELFDSQEDADDDESGPVTSSTQIVHQKPTEKKTTSINNNQNIINSNYELQNDFHEADSRKKTSLFSSDTFKDGLRLNESSVSLMKKFVRFDSDNNSDFIWNEVKGSIVREISQLKLDTLLEKYTIKYYQNRVNFFS